MKLAPTEALILGIDPGSIKTGFGIVRVTALGKIEHVTHGMFLLDKKLSLALRLRDLALDLKTLLEKYCPTQAVVEDVFVFKNPRSALVLGQARGAILAVLGMHNVPIFSLSPTAIKSLVAGQGHAQKFQVARIVALELKIEPPTSQDASDALAVALAKAFSATKNSGTV